VREGVWRSQDCVVRSGACLSGATGSQRRKKRQQAFSVASTRLSWRGVFCVFSEAAPLCWSSSRSWVVGCAFLLVPSFVAQFLP
jgi:hypothetical protein